MTAESKYIGTSVAFPFSINEKGRLGIIGDAEAIIASCYSILATPIKERLFLPEFGSRLSLLFYQPYQVGTQALIATVVEEALEIWEKRCKFVTIDFDEIDKDKDKGVIHLNIQIQIKSTSEIKAFVFPFYTKLIH